jgi:trigger factor
MTPAGGQGRGENRGDKVFQMEMKVETPGPCRKKLAIEVPAARVDEEFDRAYAQVGREASVPGFRQGKAPRKVIELHYGAKVREDIKEMLVEEAFAEALKEHRFEPAVAPRLDIKSLALSPGQPFRFEVEVEVWPEVSAGGYTGIRVTKKKLEVKDEDVEGYIRMLLDRHAEFVPVDGRGLQEGDFTLLDLRGAADGAAFDEKKAAWLETGPHTYCAGFCGALYGAKPGETREFTLTLPAEGVREELRGKEASFTVLVREIKEKRVPGLTDDFCKELGSYANADELRGAVRKDLLSFAEDEERHHLLDQIHDYLLERHKVPLPQTRVAMDTVSLAEKTAARLLSQGMKKEDILERKEELMATARKEAERRLALSLLFDGIAKREKIAVAPAEMDARVGEIAARMKRDPAEVRASLEKDDRLEAIGDEILREKVQSFLLEKAKIKEAKE